MLTRTNRIQGERDVGRVYRQGKGVRYEQLSLKHTTNHLDHSRLGVVISKKVTKSAPKRNRIRRRVYEYFRSQWSRLNPGHDILISIFSVELADLPAPELARQIDELVKRAGLWVESPPA